MRYKLIYNFRRRQNFNFSEFILQFLSEWCIMVAGGPIYDFLKAKERPYCVSFQTNLL